MNKPEVKAMLRIAFVAAVVAVAVNHFIEPAAKTAARKL